MPCDTRFAKLSMHKSLVRVDTITRWLKPCLVVVVERYRVKPKHVNTKDV
jgi:hypothetical protein